MDSRSSIKSFWNRAAEDNPFWYVSSYGSYDVDRDLSEFWASGRTIWTDLKRVTGYTANNSHTVVEIGCGVGRLTRAIAPEVGHVVALDISEKMLAMGQEANLPNVEFRVAQGFVLAGIQDKSVDLALAYCVFQHLPSITALESYLREMHRVTKRGGIIAFTLVPRDWKTWLLPVLRVRALLREWFSSSGPKGIYKKEWVGIRPSVRQVSKLSPIQLSRSMLGADRQLYYGRR